MTDIVKPVLAKWILEAFVAFSTTKDPAERGKAYTELTYREDQWADYFGSLPSMDEIGALA